MANIAATIWTVVTDDEVYSIRAREVNGAKANVVRRYTVTDDNDNVIGNVASVPGYSIRWTRAKAHGHTLTVTNPDGKVELVAVLRQGSPTQLGLEVTAA